MRIAYFVNQYPKVSHSFIRREILALERQGFDVQRIALRGWRDDLVDAEDLKERGKTHYVLDRGIWGLLSAMLHVLLTRPLPFLRAFRLACQLGFRADRPLPYHLIYLAEACRAMRFMTEFGVHHVHAHFGSNSAEVVSLARALGGPPYSFTVHGPEEFDKPQGLKLAEKIRHAQFVVAISSFGRSQLYRWIPHQQWQKVKVVHCGLEQAFHHIPLVAIPAAPRMVCVGRLCEQKGQLLLLEACRLLRDKHIDFELVLAGDGEMRPEIERMIDAYDLRRYIRITGWISSEDVREEILQSRVMVLPSFAEGLPVVIMEAMALGRPVVSTYVAGIPELVIPSENGWLVPAGSVPELVAAMEEALSTPASRLEKMGKAACERVQLRHSIDQEAAKLAALFSGQAA